MRCSFLLLLCCCALLCRGQEHGEQEGGAEVAVTGQQPCAKTIAELEEAVEDVFGHDHNFTVNCAAFDENGVLEKAIVSAFAPNNNDSLRYEFVCSQQSVLIGVPLTLPPSTDNPGAACAACNPDNTSCVASECLEERTCSLTVVAVRKFRFDSFLPLQHARRSASAATTLLTTARCARRAGTIATARPTALTAKRWTEAMPTSAYVST